VREDSKVWHTEESARGHFRDFKCVELAALKFREDLFDSFARGCVVAPADNRRPDFTGQIEKIPVQLLHSSAQPISVQFLDGVPTGQKWFRLED
jgi:hypothetical protein